jgi:hypothetical protein
MRRRKLSDVSGCSSGSFAMAAATQLYLYNISHLVRQQQQQQQEDVLGGRHSLAVKLSAV